MADTYKYASVEAPTLALIVRCFVSGQDVTRIYNRDKERTTIPGI